MKVAFSQLLYECILCVYNYPIQEHILQNKPEHSRKSTAVDCSKDLFLSVSIKSAEPEKRLSTNQIVEITVFSIGLFRFVLEVRNRLTMKR